MSSRQTAALRLTKMRPRLPAHAWKAAKGCAAKKRGRRQPQAEDFQVTSELPQFLLILDKELRAIEILLGSELQELLSSDRETSLKISR